MVNYFYSIIKYVNKILITYGKTPISISQLYQPSIGRQFVARVKRVRNSCFFYGFQRAVLVNYFL